MLEVQKVLRNDQVLCAPMALCLFTMETIQKANVMKFKSSNKYIKYDATKSKITKKWGNLNQVHRVENEVRKHQKNALFSKANLNAVLIYYTLYLITWTWRYNHV